MKMTHALYDVPYSNGVGRTGTFICIHSELEKIKVEATADVFQYIKASRFHRPGLVSTIVSVYTVLESLGMRLW